MIAAMLVSFVIGSVLRRIGIWILFFPVFLLEHGLLSINNSVIRNTASWWETGLSWVVGGMMALIEVLMLGTTSRLFWLRVSWAHVGGYVVYSMLTTATVMGYQEVIPETFFSLGVMRTWMAFTLVQLFVAYICVTNHRYFAREWDANVVSMGATIVVATVAGDILILAPMYMDEWWAAVTAAAALTAGCIVTRVYLGMPHVKIN